MTGSGCILINVRQDLYPISSSACSLRKIALISLSYILRTLHAPTLSPPTPISTHTQYTPCWMWWQAQGVSWLMLNKTCTPSAARLAASRRWPWSPYLLSQPWCWNPLGKGTLGPLASTLDWVPTKSTVTIIYTQVHTTLRIWFVRSCYYSLFPKHPLVGFKLTEEFPIRFRVQNQWGRLKAKRWHPKHKLFFCMCMCFRTLAWVYRFFISGPRFLCVAYTPLLIPNHLQGTSTNECMSPYEFMYQPYMYFH